jgi:protein-tyrosine phosphatase
MAGTDDPPHERKIRLSYVDLHLHLLPGVDDGARDLCASLDHARRLTAAGISDVAVTPHIGHRDFPLDPLEVPRRTVALQDALDLERIPLRVHAAGELRPGAATAMTAAELDAISVGPPGACWVLAEVPFAGIDDTFLAGCAAIRAHGLGVVIAHPERAAGLLPHGLERLAGELSAGAVLQVNADSLLGRHGAEPREAGERLVRSGLAYLIASDGHPGTRDHTLLDGQAAALAAGVSAGRARRLTRTNPRFLLHHGLPAAPAPAPARPWRATAERRISAVRGASARLAR